MSQHAPVITECVTSYGSTYREVKSPQTDCASVTLLVKAVGINHRELAKFITDGIAERDRLRSVNAELVKALESIVDRGFDTGYYCYYCLEKTYGRGDKMTCDHKPDCYWAVARAAIARAKEGK